MSIAVIDQGAELFWFVSNALIQDEIPLKHLNTIQSSEQHILQELPEIVILNADEEGLNPVKFITRIRNHVFARNTLFIVFTSDTSLEFKRDLIIAGAGQVFYRGRGYNPSPKFFRTIVKWFQQLKAPDQRMFDYTPSPLTEEAEFTTFGRIGWVSSTQCYIEVNLDLNPGQTLTLKTTLFDELDIKSAKLVVLEKNPVGRYYQYSNGYICRIESKDPVHDQKKLAAWVKTNQNLSKHKPLKVLYYEPTIAHREDLKNMIKIDQRYCARGFSNLESFSEDLEYHLPHLVLINRALIESDRGHFEVLKNFTKSHFSFCVTYDLDNSTDIEEFKNAYAFAMHTPMIDGPLLESMIKKLEAKWLVTGKHDEDSKVFFNKHSPYSRMSLHSHCQLTELAINGVGLLLPFMMSPYCAFQISSGVFNHLQMNHLQLFRSFLNKQMTGNVYHQCIFIGQTLADNESIKKATEQIKTLGFDKWRHS